MLIVTLRPVSNKVLGTEEEDRNYYSLIDELGSCRIR